MGITTKDLAQLCGVSRTTIHRALNNTGRINPETKEMILRIAKENDYRPDMLARGLVKGKTYYIGIVVLDVNNRYFSQMLSAIGTRVNEQGYCMNIALHDEDPGKEREQLIRLSDYRVDGIILSSVNEGEEYRKFLESLGIPIVTVDNRVAEGIPFVGIEQKNAMREITERIVQQGYEKLVFVCPPLSHRGEKNMYVHEERLQGFEEIVKTAPGIEVQYLLDWSYLEQAEAALLQGKRTAFLCTSDNFALDLMKELRKSGKKPGRDYGIAGFDNIDILDYVQPRLTTISNSVEQVADTAIRLLFALIEQKQEAENASEICKNYILPYELIEGETI